jgi:hypothetical protein
MFSRKRPSHRTNYLAAFANGFRIAFIVVALCSNIGSAQKQLPAENDTLALVGTTPIMSSDLRERLELNPYLGKDKPKEFDSVKVKGLLGIVAEKLLATEARRLNIAEDSNIVRMRKGLEKLLVRDELFRKEVVEKAKPSEEEIYKGMKWATIELKLIVFTFSSEKNARLFSPRLSSTSKKDSLIRFLPRNVCSHIDTVTADFGDLEPGAEDIVFSINRSRVSKPYFAPNGVWFVFYVIDKSVNNVMAKLDHLTRQRKVEILIQARREKKIADSLYYVLLEHHQAVADSAIFTLVADCLSSLWKENPQHFKTRHGFMLSSELVDVMLFRLANYRDSVFVRNTEGTLTLGTVLEMFRYENFASKYIEGIEFKIHLNETIKSLIAADVIAHEGIRQNLMYAKNVQQSLQRWSDYWAAGAMLAALQKGIAISDEEVMTYLINNATYFGSPYEVNLCEILCSSLEEVTAVLEALQRGESMSSVAKRLSKRVDWAERGGESGFFKVSENPELGFRAMMADTGVLVSPVKLPNGFSIFKVLAKRTSKDSPRRFSDLSSNVRTRLHTEKQKTTVDQTIAKLAQEQGVVVHYPRVKRVVISPIQMFTRRYIGFGGTMSAVPLLLQQYDWYKEFQNNSPLNP